MMKKKRVQKLILIKGIENIMDERKKKGLLN